MNQHQPSEDEILNLLRDAERRSSPDKGLPTSPPGLSSVPSSGAEITLVEAERLGWLDGADGGMVDLMSQEPTTDDPAHQAAKAFLDKHTKP